MDPKYFRKLTETANEGFRTRAELERQRRLQKAVDDAVSVAPRLAEDAAKEGKDNVTIYGFHSNAHAETEADLSEDQREIVNRLRSHFENKGFKTNLWGPGSDDGSSWWEFVIHW